jgi:hypothetical protein
VEERPDDQGDHVWGRIRYRNRTLRIDGDHTPEMKRIAFFHELSHAVNDLAGMSEPAYWPKKDEEQHITATSPLWVMVFRDNPDLVAFLTAADG